MTTLRVVPCTPERHAQAILDIFNEAIANSTALYDYHPRPLSSMGPWFEAKQAGRFPVIGVENEGGELLAFGSLGTFRAWPAYQYTVEHSLYVRHDCRGQGLGRMVLTELIQAARQRGVHVMVAAIDSANAGSIGLHQHMGFAHTGTLPQVGFKFDRWLDLVFYQLVLDTPRHPVAA